MLGLCLERLAKDAVSSKAARRLRGVVLSGSRAQDQDMVVDGVRDGVFMTALRGLP